MNNTFFFYTAEVCSSAINSLMENCRRSNIWLIAIMEIALTFSLAFIIVKLYKDFMPEFYLKYQKVFLLLQDLVFVLSLVEIIICVYVTISF